MELNDVLEPALVLDVNDPVSRAVASMIKQKTAQAMVLDGKEMAGVVFAKDIVKRNINDPEKAKISRFMEHTKTLGGKETAAEAIDIMLKNDLSALPVRKSGRLYFLTKLGLIGMLRKSPELRKSSAGEIMNMPYCVSAGDSISTTIGVMKETGVSRLPVVDSSGKTQGIVDTEILLRTVLTRRKMSSGEFAGEKSRLKSVPVSGVMRKKFPRADMDSDIAGIADMMIKSGMATAVIEKNGKPVGIITPKPILRMFVKKTRTTNIRISGIHDEGEYIRSKVADDINGKVKKLGSLVHIDYLVLHVQSHHKTGKRRKYSVKGRMITSSGAFFAKDHAWDLTKAVSGALEKLEREIIRKSGKRKVHARAP
jgi:CBS domain-containing protein/ribosome-associated translation inhibitor RaiA